MGLRIDLKRLFFTLTLTAMPVPGAAQSFDARDMIGLGVEILNQQRRQQQQPQRQPQRQPQTQQYQQPQTTQKTPPKPDPAKAARRAEVLEMQAHLNRLGYDAGPVDGIPGARTRAALSAFERDHGLPSDGQLDAAALAVLRNSTAPRQETYTGQTYTGQTYTGQSYTGQPDTTQHTTQHGTGPYTPGHSETAQAPLTLTLGSNGAIDPQSGLRLPSPARFGEAVLTGWPVQRGPLSQQTVKLNRRDVSAAALDLAAFVDLHVLKSFPDIMSDEKIATEYAHRFLGGDMQARYLGDCGAGCYRQTPYSAWRGATEFERQATYQRFVQEIVPQLISHAPEFPIPTIEIIQVKLGQYDHATQSFPLEAAGPRTGYFGFVNAIAAKSGQITGPDLKKLPMDPGTAAEFAAHFGPGQRLVYIAYDTTVGPARIWPYGVHNYELPLEVTGLRVSLDPELQDVVYTINPTDAPETDVAVRDGVVWAQGRVALPATRFEIASPAPLKHNLWTALKPRIDTLVDVSTLPDHVILDRLPGLNLSQAELHQLAVTALGREPSPAEFNDLLRDGGRSSHFNDPFVKFRLVGGIKSHLSAARPKDESFDSTIPLRVYCETNLQTYDFAKAAFPLKPNCARHFMEIGHELSQLGIASAGGLNFDGATIFPSALPMPMQEAEPFSRAVVKTLLSFETDLSLSVRQTEAGPVLTLETTPPRNLQFHPQADLAAAAQPFGPATAGPDSGAGTDAGLRQWNANKADDMAALADLPTEVRALPLDASQLGSDGVLGKLHVTLFSQREMGPLTPLAQRSQLMQRRNADLAAPLGVPPDHLISVAEISQQRYPVFALLPAPADSYRVTLPADGYGRSQLDLITELEVTKAVKLRLASDREAILLLARPTMAMATETRNGPVIERFEFAAPDGGIATVSRLETPPRYILMRNLAARFGIDPAPILEASLAHPNELSIYDKRARYEDLLAKLAEIPIDTSLPRYWLVGTARLGNYDFDKHGYPISSVALGLPELQRPLELEPKAISTRLDQNALSFLPYTREEAQQLDARLQGQRTLPIRAFVIPLQVTDRYNSSLMVSARLGHAELLEPDSNPLLLQPEKVLFTLGNKEDDPSPKGPGHSPEEVLANLRAQMPEGANAIFLRHKGVTKVSEVFIGPGAHPFHQRATRDLAIDWPQPQDEYQAHLLVDGLRQNPEAVLILAATNLLPSQAQGTDNTSEIGRLLIALANDVDLEISAFPPARDLGEVAAKTSYDTLVAGNPPVVLLRRRDETGPATHLFHPRDLSVAIGSGQMSYAITTAAELKFEIIPELPFQSQRQTLAEAVQNFVDTPGTALLLSPDMLRNVFPKLADLDLSGRAYPVEDVYVGIPRDHTKTASDFALLGVSGSMSADAATTALTQEFGQIQKSSDDSLTAGGADCLAALGPAPGGTDHAGMRCMRVTLADGEVSRATLWQVIEGDVTATVIDALKQRFGWSPFVTETRSLEGGVSRQTIGWGQPIAFSRDGLDRTDAKLPPAAVEATLWTSERYTTVHVSLIRELPQIAEAAAQAPEIKF